MKKDNFLSKAVKFFIGTIFKLLFLFVKVDSDKDFKEVIKYYQKGGFSEIFTKIRLWDAPYEQLAKLIPATGMVIDLGCGDGLLANYLALKSKKRKVYGIELNKQRLQEADKGIPNTKFIYGDITKENFSKADVVLLVHVLHHLSSRASQEIVLKKIFNNLKQNGKLLIVEIIKEPFGKYLITWLTDILLVPMLFENKFFNPHIYYRESREWRNILSEIGFKVTLIKRVDKAKPFSHILIVGTKN